MATDASAVQRDGAADRRVSVGRTISRGFSAIGSNPGVMFGVSFVFGALPALAFGYVMQGMRGPGLEQMTGDQLRGWLALVFSSALLSIVLAMIVQGALVRATAAASEGRRASFGESVAAGFRVILPLIAVALLVGIGSVIGLVLLIVPGIILYVMWCVAAPALVEERIGVFEALGRSRRLTKGARWRVFALLALLVIVYWIISSVFGLVMVATIGIGGVQGMAQNGLPIGWLVSNAVLSTLMNTLWATMLASLYIELRNWKDGPDPEALAEIFA